MSKFYLLLWLSWALRVTVCSLVLACGFSFLITLFLYFNQGMPTPNEEVVTALFDLFKFWFALLWNFTFLVALFRSLKYIFNNPHAGYELKLLNCKRDEVLQEIGYGDLIKVWRKWFMLLIWLVGSFMILSLAYTYMFTSLNGVFEWFTIYWLFGFVLVAGYFSFIMMGSRCTRVKVKRC
ncbi:MAG: hypothetical protein AUK54_01370 [Helicobacteraceae bacterium CG2_30_36_10]|nr:MAG: hypothetical protein AUK54_01370 [Helicobacteraceae bacterium CG2_30_36_10]